MTQSPRDDGMPTDSGVDRAYFMARAAAERAMADRAADPAIASIHRALAEAYDVRRAQLDGGSDRVAP